MNATQICYNLNVAEWDFATDVNSQDKEQAAVNVTLASAEVSKYYWLNYFENLTASDYPTEAVRRQVDRLKILGNSALDADKLQQVCTEFIVCLYATF